VEQNRKAGQNPPRL